MDTRRDRGALGCIQALRQKPYRTRSPDQKSLISFIVSSGLRIVSLLSYHKSRLIKQEEFLDRCVF
ncbi:MAG: hypothetical protein F6J93_21350 [Oscillatoria sp. SIO1A7]|nr:hypothetical protein [Oscillatoria sp. SIO1A7]